MATNETNYGQKDIVTPRAGHFQQTLSWTLDSTTNLSVGWGATYDFSASTFGKVWDNDIKPYTAAPVTPIVLNQVSRQVLSA